MRSGLDYNFDDLSISEQFKYITETPFIEGPDADLISKHYSTRLAQFRTLSQTLANPSNSAYKKQKKIRQQLFLIDPFNPQLLEELGNLWAKTGFAGDSCAVQYWSAALKLDSSRTALNNRIQQNRALSHWDFQFKNFDDQGLSAPLSYHVGTGKYLLEAVLDSNQSNNPYYQEISATIIKYIDLYIAKTPLDTIKNDSYGKNVFECAAYAYMILNQNQAALAALNKHIKLTGISQNASIYVKRGEICSRLDDISEAINNFERAIIIDPLSPAARVALREEHRKQNIQNREKAEAQTALENKAKETYSKAIQARLLKQEASVKSAEEDSHTFTDKELISIANILLLIIKNNRTKAMIILNQRGLRAHDSISKLSDLLTAEHNSACNVSRSYENKLKPLNDAVPEKSIHSAINGVKAIPTLFLGMLPTIHANAVMSKQKYNWLLKVLKTQLDESGIFQHPRFTGWTRMHLIYQLSRALQPYFVAKPSSADCPEVKFLIRQRDTKNPSYQNNELIDAIQQAIQIAQTAYAPLADCLANYLQPHDTINREKITKIIAEMHNHYFSGYNQKELNALFSSPEKVSERSSNTHQANTADKLQSKLLAAEKSLKLQLLEIDSIIDDEQVDLLQEQKDVDELHAKIALNEQLATQYRNRCSELYTAISELPVKAKDTHSIHAQLAQDLSDLKPQLSDLQEQLSDFNAHLRHLQDERKALLESVAEKQAMIMHMQHKQTILATDLTKVQDLLTPRTAALQQKALLATSQLQDATSSSSDAKKSSASTVEHAMNDARIATVQDRVTTSPRLFAPTAERQQYLISISASDPSDYTKARTYSPDEKKSTLSPVDGRRVSAQNPSRLFTQPISIIKRTSITRVQAGMPQAPSSIVRRIRL